MVHLVKGEKSNFFSTQDRYYISDGEAALYKEGENGIKKASLFQRLFGGAVKVIIDNQEIYLNKCSLDEYLNRRIKRLHGSRINERGEAVQGFITASRLDADFGRMLAGDEAAKKRGNQLKAISTASLQNKKVSLINQRWHKFYNAVSQEIVHYIFGVNEPSDQIIKWNWFPNEHRYRIVNASDIPRPVCGDLGQPNREIIENAHADFLENIINLR